jgi:hypothetical protein
LPNLKKKRQVAVSEKFPNCIFSPNLKVIKKTKTQRWLSLLEAAWKGQVFNQQEVSDEFAPSTFGRNAYSE